MSACSLAQTLADAALADHYPAHVRDTAQMICNLISEAMDTTARIPGN